LVEGAVADEAAVAISLSELLEVICELEYVLLQQVFFLSHHGELPLEIFGVILVIVDSQLELCALLSLRCQVFSEHLHN